jgi:hypothetical protein
MRHALSARHSPLEKTPHKACNGELSITCRNRHCPKCQSQPRDRWLAARRTELLAAPYAHVVFKLPHQLAPLALQNKELIYGLLFSASAHTLFQIASDARHLGAEIGFFSVLRTWNQQLLHHPHVHCVVPAGGLSPDHCRWIPAANNFFLPVAVLSRVFRGKFVAGLRRLHAGNKLGFHGKLTAFQSPKAFSALLRSLFRTDWVVYSKRPFGNAGHALHYLGCYTHRIAISSHRLVSLSDGRIYCPVARFRSQEQEAAHVAQRGRIPAAVPASCAAPGVRSHPALRPLRPPASR